MGEREDRGDRVVGDGWNGKRGKGGRGGISTLYLQGFLVVLIHLYHVISFKSLAISYAASLGCV